MRDKSLGMILATAIAAPVMIVCCGGGAALIGLAMAGSVGYISGSGLLNAALIVVVAGIAILAFIRRRQRRKWHDLKALERG